MSDPIAEPSNLDDAIALYQAGKTTGECAAMCGIGSETFRQRLIARGIPTRGQAGAARLRRKPTPPGLVEDFLSGTSVKALAGKHGINRKAVYRMLSEAGVDGRDRSSAMLVRWQRASASQRAAMVAAAHEASRGKPQDHTTRVQIASTKAGRPFSEQETALCAMLAQLGYPSELGVPLDKYNLDIVVAGTVAVEIFGGGWHAHGRHRARFDERARHILDAGYSLAIVWTDKVKYPLGVTCAQHLATLVEITRGHPSIGRQHWVIRGDGQFLAAREDDGEQVPFVSASGSRSY